MKWDKTGGIFRGFAPPPERNCLPIQNNLNPLSPPKLQCTDNKASIKLICSYAFSRQINIKIKRTKS